MPIDATKNIDMQIFLLEFDTFSYVLFKGTSNLIFLNFRVPSESFFSQEFQNRSYLLTKGAFIYDVRFLGR